MNEQESSSHIPASTTERDRKRFWFLVVLGGVVIVLFWIALLPFTLHTEDGPAGPRAFFHKIGEQLSLTGVIFNKTKEVQEVINESK